MKRWFTGSGSTILALIGLVFLILFPAMQIYLEQEREKEQWGKEVVMTPAEIQDTAKAYLGISATDNIAILDLHPSRKGYYRVVVGFKKPDGEKGTAYLEVKRGTETFEVPGEVAANWAL